MWSKNERCQIAKIYDSVISGYSVATLNFELWPVRFFSDYFKLIASLLLGMALKIGQYRTKVSQKHHGGLLIVSYNIIQ